MHYDREILRILAEAGNEGLSVQKISRHVFNACNSFFNPLCQNEVHKYVQSFLLKNSKSVVSLVEKRSKGVYRLNEHCNLSQQLYIQFRDDVETPKDKPVEDQSLNLFEC